MIRPNALKTLTSSPGLFGSLAVVLALVFPPVGMAPIALAADCNANGIDDDTDIASGASDDCNADGRPDECELQSGAISFDETRTVIGGEEGYVFSWVQADLDGDGDIDLASAKIRVALAFNRGDGFFGAPEFAAEEVAIPGGPWNDILAEDLDGDGDIDLALSSQHRPETAILTNDGSGRFTVTQLVELPGESTRLRAVDIDLDGDTDLISIAISYRDQLRIYDTFALLRNRGDANFDVEFVPLASYSGAPLPVDLNGDGFPDIVSTFRVFDESHEIVDGGVVVRINAGDGTFPVPTSTSLGAWPRRLATEDLDGDGDVDLAAVIPERDAVVLLRNRGDGSFDDPVEVPAGGPVYSLRAADIDADGDTDLIASERPSRVGDSTVGPAILWNDGNGTFELDEIRPLTNSSGLEFMDLDGDGLLDVVAWFYIFGDQQIQVLRNLGGGSFGEAVRLPTASTVYRVASTDLDGDGDLDLVVSSPIQTLRNVTGDESFGFGCADFVRGDANADGTVSLADAVTLTRFQHELRCRDAADANDDERTDLCDATFLMRTLFFGEVDLPAPYPVPGDDPTPEPVTIEFTGSIGCTDIAPSARAGCSEYSVEPPQSVDDTIRIGDVFALPSGEVSIPIFVTISEAIEGLQLVLEYDPDIVEFGRPEFFRTSRSVDFEGSFYGQFPPDPGGWHAPNMSAFRADPELGLAFVGIIGGLWSEGFDIPPGEDILVASLRATVSADVPPGTRIWLEPTNGPDGRGVGPYFLRNELIHRGQARFVSVIPRTERGFLQIVGDQSYFVRGDSNGDWAVDVSDSIHTLAALFLGGPESRCPDAADSNDDGTVDLSDAVNSLQFLFFGDSTLPGPFPGPGLDPTADRLNCLRLPQSR